MLYAAVAFAFLEASDIVIPALGLPGWTIRWVIGLAFLGFPVTLVLAWIYDLTPHGVIRTGSRDEEAAGSRRAEGGHPMVAALLLLASGALIATGALFTFQWSQEGPASEMEGGTDAELDPLRIAVLPLEAFDDSEEGVFLAEGIHEDILNYLAKIGSLEVISRTTVKQYRDSGLSARQIGRELGAGSILEGTVRTQEGRVRVVIQLIDATTQTHIWSETYNREGEDVFHIQSSIAQDVARALQAELTPQELELLETPTSVSVEAYDRYSQGIFQWDRRETRANALWAVELFEEATELDPDFARAFAFLSQARMWLFWNFPGNQGQAQLAREALDRARELAPNAVETRLAQGYFFFYGRGDSEEALRHFAAAEALKPSDADVISATGLIYRGQGRWDEAIQAFERARTYDPRSYNLNYILGDTYLRMRRLEEAERYFQWAATLAPEVSAAHRGILLIRLAATGDTVAGREYIENLPGTLLPTVRRALEAELAYFRRDYEAALGRGTLPGGSRGRAHQRPAILYHLMGNDELRDRHADSLKLISEETIRAAREDPGPVQTGVVARAHAKLGIAHALLGEAINASVEGSSAVIHLPLSVDAYEGADHVRDLAVTYTLIGEVELALEQLETAVSVPSPLTRVELELDPIFDPLRGHPRYEELLASLQ